MAKAVKKVPRNRFARQAEAKPPPRAWYQNPLILSRLEQVEALRLKGYSAMRTAEDLGIGYDTVKRDYLRLDELAVARISVSNERLRAQFVRRLDHVLETGRVLLERDEQYTQAVLFNLPAIVTCPGRQLHETADMQDKDLLSLGNRRTAWGIRFSCTRPHPITKNVYRDERGGAQYRRIGGSVLQAMRQTVMDQARLLGLIVDKKALTSVDGTDLPAALRTLLLEEPLTPAQVRALPKAQDTNGKIDGIV